jgi:hypothetical protein
MKMKIAAACLFMASASFAVDEYLPVAPGVWELDVGYSLVKSVGTYGKDGAKKDVVGAPMVQGVPVQIKFGVAKGADLELYLPVAFQNADAGGKSGIDRPELALKYGRAEWAYAYFLNVVLPLGVSDFSENPAPGSAVALGMVYDNTFESTLRVVGQASYQYSLPAGENKNPDLATLYLKPEKVWNPKLGTYLGIKTVVNTQRKFNGQQMDDAGYVVTAMPGFSFKHDNHLSYEVNIPLTLAGKAQDETWGVWASLYYSM